MLDPLTVVHGQGQLLLCKSLLQLEIKRTSRVGVGPLCPARRGAGQFVSVAEITSVFVAMVTWGAERRRKGIHAGTDCEVFPVETRIPVPTIYRARAASVLSLSWDGALAGSGRGIAAINRCVYSWCGLAKIWPAVPHSTISP
jgi:hypothetical protein